MRPRIILSLIGILSILVFIPGSRFLPGFSHSYASENEKPYESRLDSGLHNTPAYSYLLIKKASSDKAKARELLEEARKYSPDLPAVYFALAAESFSINNIFKSVDYLRQGIEAYQRNFWWNFNLLKLLYISLVIAYVLAMFSIMLIRFPMEVRLLAHDIAEDKLKAIALPVLIILSFFGPFAFIAGVMFLLGFYFKKANKAVVYLALLVLAAAPAGLMLMDALLTVPSSELRAVVAVNEGKDNRDAQFALKGKDAFIPAFSYALALKREGNYEEAANLYTALLGRYTDSRLHINLGNTYYAVKDAEKAKDSYMKALDIRQRPSAFYNLSQIYREQFVFAKGDEYFLEAARLDPAAVSMFTAFSGAGPNRFVMDETIPEAELWEYAMKFSKDRRFFAGQMSIVGAILSAILAIVFYLVNKRAKRRAYECGKCGEVCCSKCLKTITWGQLCPQCYRSLIRLNETDAKERITRLLSISGRQTKKLKMTRLLSYLLPGAGHVYAGKILTGFLFLWPFLFFVTVFVMSLFTYYAMDSFRHGWLTPLSLILMLVSYAAVVLYTKRRMRRGWL